MLSVAGHQPNHLPYGGYFAKMSAVDKFVIVDTTQYVKKQYHNRNRILLMNGRPKWLSVPVVTSGRFHQKICEVEIDNRTNWRALHLKTIRISYANSPYFSEIFPRLESIYTKDWLRLVELNIDLIKLCRDLLKISTPLCLGSEIGITGKATHLIVDICRKTSADTYVHGKHSQDYVDFDVLTENGLKSKVQKFDCQSYPQQSPKFIPDLSVIDLLFNRGPDSLKILLAGNKIS
jgi:hypothetical protein